MRIFVLGYKGMLGRYVYSYLKSNDYYVIGLSRDNIKASCINNEILYETFRGIEIGDVIINCIGTIKPMVDKYGTLNAIKVNSLFPHILSDFCFENNIEMIHMTTDCCYSGKEGTYNENSLHDCTDIYGKTKSLGESNKCTVVRSSIIGEEIGQSRSLLEWVKSMKGKTANGFTNHRWNGVTCLQMAKIFEDIISNDKFWTGARHVFSPEIVNKYELVKMISDVYNLNINVIPTESETPCDRSLSTIYPIIFNIPPIKEQIIEQRSYLL